MLVLLPNLYVYHTCRSLHVLCTWAPHGKSSIVDLEATVQKNKDTTTAILVMLALAGADSVTATYNVGSRWHERQWNNQLRQFVHLDQVCSSAMWTQKVCGQGCSLHCVTSSIVQCVAPVKLVHRVSNH